MREVVVIIVEIGAEDSLGGLYTRARRRTATAAIRTGLVRRVGVRVFGLFELLRLGHQSTYLGVGGAGAGPRTVNHLRYNVFHVPSRRMRSSVPLTNRTRPVLSRLTPTP